MAACNCCWKSSSDEEMFDTVADCFDDDMNADVAEFVGGLKAAESPDGLKAAESADGMKAAESADGMKAAESADGLKAAESADGMKDAESADGMKDAESADGLKAADWAACAEPDVAGKEGEESAVAEGGGAPRPLSQPAAPPLPQVMGMAEMVIELVPLVLPVTVLLFGWFGGAWLE